MTRHNKTKNESETELTECLDKEQLCVQGTEYLLHSNSKPKQYTITVFSFSSEILSLSLPPSLFFFLLCCCLYYLHVYVLLFFFYFFMCFYNDVNRQLVFIADKTNNFFNRKSALVGPTVGWGGVG